MLLKVLLTEPGRVFSEDQLADAIYPESDPSHVRSNIQARISDLRRVLQPTLQHGRDSLYVLRRGEGYMFDADSDCLIDTLAFDEQLTAAHKLADQKLWAEAVQAFDGALSLYRGEFLCEDPYEEWAEGTRRRLAERYTSGLSRLAACYAQLEQLRQSISCCQRILALEPHRESVVQQLMEYQSQAGQRVAALETYHEGERALREYLNVAPSAEIKALYKRLSQASSSQQDLLDSRRVAVLPFQNHGPDSADEYIANGLTEELIGCIAKVRDLRVLAHTSVMQFQGTTAPISEIASTLKVGTVLEGAVRKLGTRIRINVQLIDASTEEHLWAEDYDRPIGEILAAQCDVAREVARALALRLSPEEETEFRAPAAVNPLAYEHYRKARHFSETPIGRHNQALDHYKHALRIDPDYAQAHAGLAEYHVYSSDWDAPLDEAYRLARMEAEQALALDDGLPEAHTALGLVQLLFERDPIAADASFHRAISLNPSYARAHLWRGAASGVVGAHEKALAELRKARELDPLSPYTYQRLSTPLAALNRFAEAIHMLDNALELDPSHRPSLARLVRYRCLLWDWSGAEEGICELDRRGHHTRATFYRSLLAMYRGSLQESQRLAEEWLQLVASSRKSRVRLGLVLLQELFLCARRYNDSLGQMALFMDQSPIESGGHHHGRVLLLAAMAYEQLGQFDRATEVLHSLSGRVAQEVLYQPLWVQAAQGMLLARHGKKEEAEEILEALEQSTAPREVSSACAVLAFKLDMMDRGFKWLTRAVDTHDTLLLLIKSHPWFDPARGDPRFRSVLSRMNLTG